MAFVSRMSVDEFGCLITDCSITVPYPFLTNNPFHIRGVIYASAGGLAWVSFWVINACHPGRLLMGDDGREAQELR
jgi:hypothetical protein